MYLLLTYLFVYPNFDLIYPDDECTFYDFIIDLKEINSIFSTYLRKQFIHYDLYRSVQKSAYR